MANSARSVASSTRFPVINRSRRTRAKSRRFPMLRRQRRVHRDVPRCRIARGSILGIRIKGALRILSIKIVSLVDLQESLLWLMCYSASRKWSGIYDADSYQTALTQEMATRYEQQREELRGWGVEEVARWGCAWKVPWRLSWSAFTFRCLYMIGLCITTSIEDGLSMEIAY